MLRTLALAALICWGLCAHADPHPFSVQDLVRLKRLSEPTLSPDERFIAFTVRETDLAADRGRTDLWLLDVRAADAPRRLTSHAENDGSPQWSRDSRFIYFLSSRSGSQQLWRIGATGGEAEQITRLPVDIGTFRLSPDERTLAFTTDVLPACGREPEVLTCTADRRRSEGERKARGMVFDRIFVRHWDSWDDGTVSHLFVAAFEGDKIGTLRDLTSGLDADIPSKPFGDASEYSFTPDSSELIFATRLKGKSEPWSTNFDLYSVPVNGRGAPRNLTADNTAWDTQPIFSADGRWLAWRAMERPGFEADRFHIVILDRKSGTRRALTKSWDATVNHMAFAPDSQTLYALTDHLGQQSLWSVSVTTGQPKMLVEQGHVDAIAAGAKTVYFSSANLRSPADLYTVPARGGAVKRITQINSAALADTRMGEPEQFTFTGADGDTVYAYIVKPVDFDANEKYPLAFFVHGGPQSSFGNAWSYRWNPQTYAGAGYAFLAIDFHGSPGYGQKFTDSISGDWGGKPLEDLQQGFAAALQKYPWLDSGRVCALGASYGGYMINWMAGAWHAPFRCFVNHAGILDSRFMGYSTEELWFDEWEHRGTPFDAPQNYEKHNPVNRVKEWRVPMLVIAGQRDYRIPYAQSIATFTALQRRGIASRLLIFPNENHWVLKPSNSVQWHEEVSRWLQEYLRPQ